MSNVVDDTHILNDSDYDYFLAINSDKMDSEYDTDLNDSSIDIHRLTEDRVQEGMLYLHLEN